MTIQVVGHRFENFFDLYYKLREEIFLVYIIGECHHCYIGAVGLRGGTGGLAVRYQKSYIERSKAIFGLEKPTNQPAFALTFPDTTEDFAPYVKRLEGYCQEKFLQMYTHQEALFDPQSLELELGEIHLSGELPEFLT